MSSQSRTTLKANFETGDKPDGTDYAELIDSFLALTDTSQQSVVSDVIFNGQVSLGQSPVIAEKLTVASAGSPHFYLKVLVSGVSYGIPVYKD